MVLIAYNAEARIERALETVLAQTLASLELVVVDDGSADATVAVATAVAATDPRVRVLQQRNGGPASARNHGIREAPAMPWRSSTTMTGGIPGSWNRSWRYRREARRRARLVLLGARGRKTA